MGLFGGSTTTTTNEKFDTGPSSFQKPYLDAAFGGAQSAYDKSKGTPYYQGQTYAGMSPEARQALDAMRGWASGTGMGTATTLSNIGSSMAGYAGKAGAALDAYGASFGADGQKRLMESARAYADDPFLQGNIDAATRDVTRNLTEDVLPGIDRAASAGGNINSSRAGIASGIAQRGAGDRIADISAQMRGDAYNRGLDMARSDRDAQLGLATAYGNLGQAGMEAMRSGAEAGYGAFDRINAAGALEQADRQGGLDADFEKWQGEDAREWDLLNRYSSIVAGNQWGQSGTSSGTSKVKQSGGILGQLVGAASVAASFSDRRLKKAIRKVGELASGLGVYIWAYIWEPDSAVNIGVMADEVSQYCPEALGPTILGFQTVDYAKLPR